MYLHSSITENLINSNKKLILLKNGVITFSQFINLIDNNDPYTIIGPAIVDKTKINEFIQEWKSSSVTLKSLETAFIEDIKPDKIFKMLPNLVQYFPEIQSTVDELTNKLNTSICPTCQKNKYILSIIRQICELYKDNRDVGEYKEIIETILNKYFPLHNKIITNDNLNDFDINWVKPDTLIGLGRDLIDGLSNCFNCCKKHLSRAKILYEEWQQGYPEHSILMYNEFTEANKVLEEGYILFWDSLAQLDMASCELVGRKFWIIRIWHTD